MTIGAGTELKRLLRRFGINPNDCKCEEHVLAMDIQGPDWCMQNLETIISWLEEAAHKRRLPFARMAGRVLVRRAIRDARRKLQILERQK